MTGNLTTSTSGNLTLILNPELCTLQTCDLSLADYSYIPSIGGNALYTAIFALLFIVQLGLGINYRTWGFMVAILLGLATEAVGYGGRIMIWQNPFDNNAFLINLICLTIAPALISASIYLCLARIVTIYGAHLSRFAPRSYTLIFCGCDLFSLVLQGLGGGIAATGNSYSQKNTGKNILIAGLAFQVVSLAIFVILCADYAWRLKSRRSEYNAKYLTLVHSKKWRYFLAALAVATTTIFIRCVFRVIELSGGFNGSLFNDQIAFMILEGPMLIIACICLTVLHPGMSFQGTWAEANFKFWAKVSAKGRRNEREYGGDTIVQTPEEKAKGASAVSV